MLGSAFLLTLVGFVALADLAVEEAVEDWEGYEEQDVDSHAQVADAEDHVHEDVEVCGALEFITIVLLGEEELVAVGEPTYHDAIDDDKSQNVVRLSSLVRMFHQYVNLKGLGTGAPQENAEHGAQPFSDRDPTRLRSSAVASPRPEHKHHQHQRRQID